MLEHTKKHHIEGVEFCALVRADSVEAVRTAIAPYVLDPINWKDVYPNFHPGQALKGARIKEDLTQAELSKKMAIPQRHISEMENGKRPIGKAMAKRFAEVLNVGYRIML